ncbi:RNA-binding ASCH domain protein [Striga hermonthica]|uniref:RNA-binding ASCH domain protein n=1 Tax=Striga hermonthica TaxID=68872 RepID=A0A9N7RS91_STRHE|nr:RNA-binding ASCH domain protein [Striga hermonthica]
MGESPPSSPGVPPVQLRDCLEELLKFTLLSSINGRIHTGLSVHYCAKLLEHDDPANPILADYGVSSGVPSYPLYKHLAASLYQLIHFGTLCTTHKEIIPMPEDRSLKNKDGEWNKLVMEKGSSLLSMLKQVDFELHVQEPFFSQLNDGLKTVEGRCAVGDYNRIQGGDLLLFNKCLTLEVKDTRKYASFHEMLEAEILAEVLPGVSNIEEGIQIYRRFYSEEKEMSNGVLAICVKTPPSQPHVIMASLLSDLSYSGVQKLLGFVETTGTNPELLPPSASTLLSTFSAPHNPDVKGSNLTNGARALAKHVNRSREGYWGFLRGSDSEKNRHAMDVIRSLLTHCSWMNMHIVRPHGNVLEVRTDDGYGARWSEDGSKFIGFLEPYMVDGYSCGWKH